MSGGATRLKPMKEPLAFVFSKKSKVAHSNESQEERNRNWVLIPFETSQNDTNKTVPFFLFQRLKKNG